MAKSILHTIERNMPTFSKGQKRIADYILQNYDKAAFMTASKLGKLSGVSESTVVRFASELGYDGYPSMQRALQEMIRSRLTSTQRIQAAACRGPFLILPGSSAGPPDVPRSIVAQFFQNSNRFAGFFRLAAGMEKTPPHSGRRLPLFSQGVTPSAPASSCVKYRHFPGGRSPSSRAPSRTRRSRFTVRPHWAHIRRTCRFFPS